jgi:hypothetical protein
MRTRQPKGIAESISSGMDTLNQERLQARFVIREMTYFIDGGVEKTRVNFN